MAFNRPDTGPTINQPTAPGAGLNQSPVPVAPLGLVLGFVTEFNANVQVFNAITGLIIHSALKTSALEGITSRLNSDVAGLKSRVTLLEAGIKLQSDDTRRHGYSGSITITKE